jgi:hypothetical protein
MGSIISCSKGQDDNVPYRNKNIMSKSEWNKQKAKFEKENAKRKEQHDQE